MTTPATSWRVRALLLVLVPTWACSSSEVRLAHFDASSDVIIADLAALFAGVDLSLAGLCHSSGAACEPFFDSLGLALTSGQSVAGQTVFHVAP
jgi:hypothetical protein